jgi:hypothetical protein
MLLLLMGYCSYKVIFVILDFTAGHCVLTIKICIGLFF